MHTEKAIYTQAAGVPDLEAPVFVTVAVADQRRQLVIQESHVFLPQNDTYLHKINYFSNSSHDFGAVIVSGIRATHRLHTEYMASRAADRHPIFDPLTSLDADALEAHPFHRFRLENKFIEQMWEIQEWTASRELRQALAQVTRYKTDHAEAELIHRIFASQVGSTAQILPVLQLSQGRRFNYRA